MQKIPDIAYVFASLAVVACLHAIAPGEMTGNLLTLIVGGLIGIASKHATERTTNVSGDVTMNKEG